MKVGIIGAMDLEIATIKQQLSSKKQHIFIGYEFYTGSIDAIEIVLVKSGIGKVNAAVSTTLLNHHFNLDCIINIGSAGGFDKSLNIGDVIISTEVRNHDVDVTAFGYEYGQIPKMPAFFSSNQLLVDFAMAASEVVSPNKVVQGLIISGDTFIQEINKIDYIRTKFNDILAAEMEACAIAQVCHQFNIPFLIIRSLSDMVGSDSSTIHDQFLELASKNSTALALAILEKIRHEKLK